MKKPIPFRFTISLKLFLLLTIMLLAVFLLKVWLNSKFYTELVEKNMYDHAIQVSDLIKSSTWHLMLKNHRGDLENIITNIGKEKGLEGVWIYDKMGIVKFASDASAVNSSLEKDAEQCSFCHASDEAKGTIPKLNRIRHLESETGGRIVGLINPIENSRTCTNAECHAHSPKERLLGLIDIKMSLEEVDKSMRETQGKVFLLSGLLVVLTALLFRGFIQRMINRPISKLVYGTEQVAAMNLDHRISVDTNDDLGHLSASFNTMTEELKRASESEKEWSEKLEEKIREKTEELERTHEHIILVEKMASLGKLAAVVAHEINNPMAGILTYSKLTIKNLSGSPGNKDISDSVDNLRMIGDEAKRCGDIVKNLLLFSRRRYEEMSEQDIKPIINRSIELAKHSIKKGKVILRQEILTENTLLVCDPTGIQQMLLIFLINAIDAVPDLGGEIVVRLTDVEDKKVIRLEISDNGTGISKEDMSYIYEPFFTTKDSDENTGLGLAVAYRIIVTRHGGKISVDSEVGEGTTFTIELPVYGPVKQNTVTMDGNTNPNREVS